jgi:hypothetical protein
LYNLKINIIKLIGFGWSSLSNIDPNVENFCGAGIIHTSQQQFGCLYRLEPNKQAQVKLIENIYHKNHAFSHLNKI